MRALDTSVVVPAASSWHAEHGLARAVCAEPDVRLPAHVLVEAYATLTRLPPPYRVSPVVARDWLTRRFEHAPLELGADRYGELFEVAAEGGIAGGAVYDAVVGATSRAAGALLVTLDRRAARTYQAMGAPYQFLR